MGKIAFVFFFVAVSMLFAETRAAIGCSKDEDCPGGCCAETKTGNVCQSLGKAGDICDLEGQGLAKDKCDCEKGLKCVKIDLSDFGPTAAAVNPIFEKFHYGKCDVDAAPVG